MKKNHFRLLMLAAMLTATVSLPAQVTVGSDANPRPGALLDMNGSGVNRYLGSLLLPNVSITSLTAIPTGTNGFTNSLNAGQRTNLAGSVVYNINSATGEGQYLWTGTRWTRVMTCLSPAITASSPAAVTVAPGQTTGLPVLSVTLSGGPLTCQWYRGTSPLEDAPVVGATYNTFAVPASDATTAGATVNYWCKVSSTGGCGVAKSTTFTVTVKADPAGALPTGTGTFSGPARFDIAVSNDGGGCAKITQRQGRKTDFSLRTSQDNPAPPVTISGVQVYTFTPSAAVSRIRFQYQELSGVSVDSIVPQNPGDASNNNLSGPHKVTVYYKASLNTAVKGTRNGAGNRLKLYAIYNSTATYSNSANDKKLELNISIQDCAFCEGALIPGGAFDYANGTPGDWAVGKVVDNDTVKQNTGILDASTPPGSSSAAGDLCWYKKNAPLSNQKFSVLITNCANGTFADSDPAAGWYLPSYHEHIALRSVIVTGSGASAVLQPALNTVELFGGFPDSQPMSVGFYHTSTENTDLTTMRIRFREPYIIRDGKTVNSQFNDARCVRRF
jgi:hypothetical protein